MVCGEKIKMKIPKIFSNVRVVVLIIALILSAIAIAPHFNREGVAIRSVDLDSSAHIAGFKNPEKYSRPLDYELIEYINGNKIHNEEDYYKYTRNLESNITISIKTNRKLYSLVTKPKYIYETTPELINKTFSKIVSVNKTINGTIVKINKTINKTELVNKTIRKIVGTEDIGLNIFDAPQSNIRKGLDLSGGVRVLLKPRLKDNETIDSEMIDRSISGLEQRLNAFGLNDLTIRKSNDLSGNTFILIEIAGLQKKEISELIESQGKFEAKINNQTAFTGGKDVSHVCRTAECSGINPNSGCGKTAKGYSCRFYFTINMIPSAARKQAELTSKLDVINENGQQYLSKKIKLFLDDQLVDELNIGAGLKGKAETRIQISGGGEGETLKEAKSNALDNMKRLQTIIETGSLPVKLDIVKVDNLSPMLGKEFLNNALMTGLIALLVVASMVFIRYKSLKVSLPMILATTSELIILLGVTALLGTNLDLAAIAGIIIVIGSSFDHQIVITDELLRGESEKVTNWKQKIQNAFFIIMAAYFTTVVAMVPLWFAGAGILKGFAVTTIYGVSIGVFITRPAFAVIVEYLLKE